MSPEGFEWTLAVRVPGLRTADMRGFVLWLYRIAFMELCS